MTRAILEGAAAFLIPFVLFAMFLTARRRNPLAIESWSQSAFWLVMAGLGCVFFGFILTGIFADRQTGVFVPTHVENGVLVPGRFR
jgi:uncharacterized membrane protein (DUF485 family)